MNRTRIASRIVTTLQTTAAMAALIAGLAALCHPAEVPSFPLNSLKGLDLRGVKAEPVTYLGRKAIRVRSLLSAELLSGFAAGQRPTTASGGGGGLIVIPGIAFHNGSIEVDLSGKPVEGAPPEARGFVGVVFRMNADTSKYEYVYLRPTNGRSEDQERRNHTTQYASHPDYGFFRLRSESPGKYESYADIAPGEWTKVRIDVSGVTMRLYINGAPQPVLVVNDLKLGDTEGAIALSTGLGTEAHFANLRIRN